MNIDEKSQENLKKLQFRISYIVKRISLEIKKDRKFLLKKDLQKDLSDI